MSESRGLTRSVYVVGQHAGYVVAVGDEKGQDGLIEVTIRLHSGRRVVERVEASTDRSGEAVYLARMPA